MSSDLILAFFFFATLIVVANLTARRGDAVARRLFVGGLFLVNGPLLLYGIALVSGMFDSALPELDAAAARSSGWLFIYVAVLGGVMLLPPVRRLLARLMPLDPDSPVHILALMFAGYLIGQAVANQLYAGFESLENLQVTPTIFDIVLQQGLFLGAGFLGVGLLIRRTPGETARRLGLSWPTWHQLRYGLLWIFPLVIFQALVGLLWALLNPEQAELAGQVNQALLADFDTLGEWFIIGLAPGISEEVLFRGALQPIFGIWIASLLFAAAHTQYALSPATLAVFVVGLVLGRIRIKHNTTTAMVVHFGYNFVLGLISLAASQAQNVP